MRTAPYFLLLMLILAACGAAEAMHDADDIETGDTIQTLDFEAADSFETGDFPESNASLTLENGLYRVTQRGNHTAYIWGQGGESVQDVQIDVEAESVSEYSNNLYGVMCRVNEDGAGYTFLISNDGFGAIARTDGRSLTFIFDWTQNDAINKGTSSNSIRAVCSGEYLALYVNDKFVADVEDDRYSDAGQVGLLAGILVETSNDEGEAVVEFDNLILKEVTIRD